MKNIRGLQNENENDEEEKRKTKVIHKYISYSYMYFLSGRKNISFNIMYVVMLMLLLLWCSCCYCRCYYTTTPCSILSCRKGILMCVNIGPNEGDFHFGSDLLLLMFSLATTKYLAICSPGYIFTSQIGPLLLHQFNM